MRLPGFVVFALLAGVLCAGCSDAPPGRASCEARAAAIAGGDVCVARDDQRGQKIVELARQDRSRISCGRRCWTRSDS
jgi:coenzyme F420-reducing hydrogenase gamma subunit